MRNSYRIYWPIWCMSPIRASWAYLTCFQRSSSREVQVEDVHLALIWKLTLENLKWSSDCCSYLWGYVSILIREGGKGIIPKLQERFRRSSSRLVEPWRKSVLRSEGEPCIISGFYDPSVEVSYSRNRAYPSYLVVNFCVSQFTADMAHHHLHLYKWTHQDGIGIGRNRTQLRELAMACTSKNLV